MLENHLSNAVILSTENLYEPRELRSLSDFAFWPAESTCFWQFKLTRKCFPATTLQIPAFWPTGVGELSGSNPWAGTFWPEPVLRTRAFYLRTDWSDRPDRASGSDLIQRYWHNSRLRVRKNSLPKFLPCISAQEVAVHAWEPSSSPMQAPMNHPQAVMCVNRDMYRKNFICLWIKNIRSSSVNDLMCWAGPMYHPEAVECVNRDIYRKNFVCLWINTWEVVVLMISCAEQAPMSHPQAVMCEQRHVQEELCLPVN